MDSSLVLQQTPVCSALDAEGTALRVTNNGCTVSFGGAKGTTRKLPEDPKGMFLGVPTPPPPQPPEFPRGYHSPTEPQKPSDSRTSGLGSNSHPHNANVPLEGDLGALHGASPDTVGTYPSNQGHVKLMVTEHCTQNLSHPLADGLPGPIVISP